MGDDLIAQLRQWAYDRRHFDATRRQAPLGQALLNLLDEHEALKSEVARLREAVGEQRHIVDIGDERFGLQHPVECRPDLLSCQVDAALTALDGAPAPPGRYVVYLADDGLHFSPLEDGEAR